MIAVALAKPPTPSTPHGFADFLFEGLTRSGCIKSRAAAWRWLSLRTRDNEQANLFLDALFPNG